MFSFYKLTEQKSSKVNEICAYEMIRALKKRVWLH